LSLLTIVPTRARPEKVARLIDSFDLTTDNSDLLFIVDPDDDSMKGFDFKGHTAMMMEPRGTMVQKLNYAVAQYINDYDHIAWYADDNEFVTRHWDTLMLETLKDMGGSGWVYSYDKRRTDIPETWLASTDVIRELGWYANPILNQYYVADSIAILGKRSSLLSFCKEAVIPHHHYDVDETATRDALHEYAETTFGKMDLANYQAWAGSNQVSAVVSRLRRKFNPDVQWVLGKV
jgi:hypothetical protein